MKSQALFGPPSYDTGINEASSRVKAPILAGWAVPSQILGNRYRGSGLLFFPTMNSGSALQNTALVLLMLTMWATSSRAQASAPAHPHVELEAKPPDEPSSDSTPNVEPAPDAAPPPSSTESNGAPIDANAVAQPPEIVTYVVPEYPAKARAQGIQGRVMLSIVIDESGKVEDDVEVVDSIPMLDGAAIDAVRQWSFTPGRDEKGHPVRVQLQVPVPFVLR